MSPYRDDQIPAARHRLQGVVTYEVLADDFDRIEQEAKSVGTDLQLACALIPVAIALTVTIKTIPIQDLHTYIVFCIVASVCYLGGVITGVRAWVQRGRLSKLMNRIRAQQGGPVGEEGKELRPSELASLPLESAPQPISQPQTVDAVEIEAKTVQVTGEPK
jgi:hypothetical protein